MKKKNIIDNETEYPKSNQTISDAEKDLEMRSHIREVQLEYPNWWSFRKFLSEIRSLSEDTFWNCFICVAALVAIVWVAIRTQRTRITLDLLYNIIYGVHVIAHACVHFGDVDVDVKRLTLVEFGADLISYSHYIVAPFENFKLCCYYIRLHRPLNYLIGSFADFHINSSIVGTTLKYCYLFCVLRVTFAIVWLEIDNLEQAHYVTGQRAMNTAKRDYFLMNVTANPVGSFLTSLYLINKMFIPVGPSVAPANDLERVECMVIMIAGCITVTGVAVASLSLVISIYLRPGEAFRARYRLIMKEMKESKVQPSLRDKVETFYKMYWHKQSAVSATQLLPTYPPTLPAAVYADIYFEAAQRSRLLCNLSHDFFVEVAKKMQTIYYIPGDHIIKRDTKKSTMIYIAYGDAEIVSAEDDSTALLRITRGTLVAACAGAAAASCARAYVNVRAATFCIAHTLDMHDLWLVANKYGRSTGQTQLILSAFNEHMKRVKLHYKQKSPDESVHKSSIIHFKKSLLALKEAVDKDGNLLLRRSEVFLEIARSYIMRNRADESETNEADAICLRPTFPCILQPWSSLQIAWQIFMAFLIVTVCFTHPYNLVFMKKASLQFRFFDFVVTLIFVVDLITYLSTGANVEEGVPINFVQTSSQQIRSTWFVLDVLGTLPIFEFIGDGHFAGINKLLRLPKVFRFLKLMEDVCVYRSNLVRFLSYTLLLLIACFLFASLQQGIMCFNFHYCIVSNFTHPPYWQKAPLDEDTLEDRLTFALIWAVRLITFTSHMETWGTKIGYSVLSTMLMLELCIVLHLFIDSVYSATIMVTTAMRDDYAGCIATVKDFLIRNDIEPVLRRRFTSYLQLCWYTDKAYSMTNNKKSIFFDLPPHVHQDIVTRQRSKYLLTIPFMKNLTKEELKTISSKAKLFYTSPNEILLNTGEYSNEMYIIKQGICEIWSPDTNQVVGVLKTRDHFGVVECMLRLPAYYTVRAATHVQIFSISMKNLTDAIEVPQIKDAMDHIKKQPEYSRLQRPRERFLWYQEPLNAPNTERFRLPRKYEEDAAFLNPFNKLGFFSILRYIFPRFTIRPDGTYLARYEWFRVACALVSAMVFPSYSYLVLQWPGLYFLTLLLDFSAYFDIFQRMLICYYNEKGVLVYHPVSTATHYLRGAFLADLVSCLPLEHLESSVRIAVDDYYKVNLSRQVLMLNRLLQLYRLPSAMINLGSYIERRDILLIMKAIPLFVALLNTLTCLMVFETVIIWRNEYNSWVIIPIPDERTSWIDIYNNTFRFNLIKTPWNLHLATYFWAVYETTTTGYNIINSSSFHLMWLLFAGIAIGAMTTTYFTVRIISIRSNVNKELASYQEHMTDMRQFMKSKNIDRDLQKEVLDYYEYNWDKTGGGDYAQLLKLCDQITLRTDAILSIYGTTFEMCPFLANCDNSLKRMIGRAVRSVFILQGTILAEADDVIRDMYFIDYGGIDLRQFNSEKNSSTVVRLGKGGVFGNLNNVATLRCPSTIVAKAPTHMLQVKSLVFHRIISDFPHVAVAMQNLRSENESYIAGDMKNEVDRKSTRSRIRFYDHRETLKHVFSKNKLVMSYLIIVSLLCVYADVYNAGYQVNSAFLIIMLYALDVGFYLKILMHISIPYFVNEDNLLTIRKRYFRSEFKYDVLSCLPLELISLACDKNRWLAFSWLRLNRMFRIVTVYKCLKRHHERITVNLTLGTIFTVLIWFSLFIHTTACLWYFISIVEESYMLRSWVQTNDGSLWCRNTYICSLYFVLTTFTQNGVGDILPKLHTEVVFVSLLQIVSTMMYMIYVGELSNIIQFKSYRSLHFYCKYLELQEFLKNNRVSRSLVQIVNKYTLHLWRESRGVQVPHFLETAPLCLKQRIMSAAYLYLLTGNYVFKDCEPAFLRQLVACLKYYTYTEGMYVVKENEITDSMYFIYSGKVQEVCSKEGFKRTYIAAESFGEEQGLIYGSPYPYSYCTLTKSQILTLNLQDWEYLMYHFPDSKRAIYNHFTDDYSKPDEYPDRKPSYKEDDQKYTDNQSSDESRLKLKIVSQIPSLLRQAKKKPNMTLSFKESSSKTDEHSKSTYDKDQTVRDQPYRSHSSPSVIPEISTNIPIKKSEGIYISKKDFSPVLKTTEHEPTYEIPLPETDISLTSIKSSNTTILSKDNIEEFDSKNETKSAESPSKQPYNSELIEISAPHDQAETASVRFPLELWPLNNRRSDVSEVLHNNKSDLSVTKSTGTMLSLPSYSDSGGEWSSIIIRKIENRAKKIFGKTNKTSLPSVDSGEKDNLLIQEDEAATTALLRQFKKDNQKISELSSGPHSKQPQTHLKRTKSKIKIVDPDDDYPIVLSNSDEEQPTSTARMKRTVHYKDDTKKSSRKADNAKSADGISINDDDETDSNKDLHTPDSKRSIRSSSDMKRLE